MPFCEIDDIKIFFEDHGVKDKVPLIFVHGIMGNSDCWKPQIEHFKDERRVIIFDLRGHGQSDKPEGTYSIERFSEDLLLLMKKLDIEKAIIVGHSLGGMISLRFTIDHQEMVEKLILLNTGATHSLKTRLFLSLAEANIRVHYRSFVKRYVSMVIQENTQIDLEKAQEIVLRTPKHVVLSCFSELKKFDVTSRLTDIQTPTLIIHGSEDTQQPVSKAEYLKMHIPNSELMIFEGVGHLTVIETPEKISEAIERFISK